MEHFLETWGYLAVFVLSFISSMGFRSGPKSPSSTGECWPAVRSRVNPIT